MPKFGPNGGGVSSGNGAGRNVGRGSRSGGYGPIDQFELMPTGLARRHWSIQVLLFVIRWTPELLLVIAVCWLVHRLTELGLPWWAGFVIVLAVAASPLAFPWTRPYGLGVLGVAVTRHRLRAFFIACRVVTRSGRLPVIVTLWPSAVGERAWLWLPPGLSINDLGSRLELLAAACWAREARIVRSRRFSMLVEVHVVRRDPLSRGSVPSAFDNVIRLPRPAAMHNDPAAEAPSSAPPAEGRAPGRRAPGRPARPAAGGRAASGEDLDDYI